MSNALTKAKEILAKRRSDAQYAAEENLRKVMKYADYADADLKVREQMLIVARATGTVQEEEQRRILQQLKADRISVAAKYGFSPALLTPQYTCKLCNDTGTTKQGQCKCLKGEVRQLLFGNVNVNAAASFANSSNDDNAAAYSRAREWCEKFPHVTKSRILITGQAGIGKTYLCNCITNALIDKQIPVLFLTAYELSQKFLQLHTAPIEDKNLLANSLFDVDVLVIDDLGTEPILRNVTEEYMFSLFNYRINHNLTTIISTNLDLKALLELYSERTFSRMTEATSTLHFSLVGTNKRFKANKTKG